MPMPASCPNIDDIMISSLIISISPLNTTKLEIFADTPAIRKLMVFFAIGEFFISINLTLLSLKVGNMGLFN